MASARVLVADKIDAVEEIRPMENWTVLRDNKGEIVTNGDNIVLQHTQTKEIGYIEDTGENRSLFSAEENLDLNEPIEIWDDATTKLLVNLYEEFLPMLGKTMRFKTKKKLFEEIAKKLSENGYSFKPAQVENRLKTLLRKIRKRAEHDEEDTYLYEEVVQPTSLSWKESTPMIRKKRPRNSSFITTSAIEQPGPSPKNVNSGELLKLKMQQEAHFQERMKIKKEEIELKKRKLQAYEERTKAIQKKNDLLSDYLIKTSKS